MVRSIPKSWLHRGLAAGLVLLLVGMLSAQGADSTDDRLARLEELKRVDFATFVAELDALSEGTAQLSADQRERIEYLRGWQATYEGNHALAIDRLQALIQHATNPTIRFRSRSTIVNAFSLARRHTESFEHLNLLMEELPQQSDAAARAQALAVAAQLHNVVGQHEDSIKFTSQLLREATVPWIRCGAEALKADSGLKSGLLADVDSALVSSIDDCARNGEALIASSMRVTEAKLHLKHDRALAAISALQPHRSAIESTRYPYVISDMAVQLAKAHLAIGDLGEAEARAQEAIDITRPGENTEPLAEAWRVLADVASERGDYAAAFQALQRNAEVERANLDDIGQRALAFQLARYRTQAQKLEIEGLNQQNELLKLQQEVTKTAVQNARLSILLLLTVLGFAVFWALRTRKMQRHFQHLAQSDSLTGAASRPYFIEQSRRLLEKAERSGSHAALLIMDLDFFKTVNDDHGHAVGDEMLRRAADCCRDTLAPHGLFGRLGGEEFGFLLPGQSSEGAVALAEQCRVAVHQIYYGEPDSPSRLSASFGVATTADDGFDLRELLIAADAALYEAKRKGRNRVVHQTRRRSDRPAANPVAANS